MYKVYKIYTENSDRIYIGVTKNDLSTRFWQHRNAVRKGRSTRAYNWMRKYLDTLCIEVLSQHDNQSDCFAEEIRLIKLHGAVCVNLAPGGNGGFVVQDIESWKKKLSFARQGRKPALGMKHTAETKMKLSTITSSRTPKYPDKVVNLSPKEAFAKFGISKTHLYRLRRKHGQGITNPAECNANQKAQSVS